MSASSGDAAKVGQSATCAVAAAQAHAPNASAPSKKLQVAMAETEAERARLLEVKRQRASKIETMPLFRRYFRSMQILRS